MPWYIADTASGENVGGHGLIQRLLACYLYLI